MNKFAPFFLGLFVVASMVAGCSSPNENANLTTVPAATPQANHVEVNYFFIYETDTSCGCYALAKQWFESTLNNDYRSQLEKGELVYFTWDSQDPANADRVNQFHSPLMAIYVTVVNGSERSTHDIRTVWMYLDPSGKDQELKNKFIDALKKDLDRSLALLG